MTAGVEIVAGSTFHGRKGAVANGFRYGVDYLLLDPEAPVRSGPLFGRNRRALASLWDVDHGGPPGRGQGAAWLRDVLADTPVTPARIELLAQPRVLGHVFNPVSFWLARDAEDALVAVVAEVTNTYGDRHSYLCHHPDGRPIGPQDRLEIAKAFHVSPFQDISGHYRFRFDIRPDRVGIWIDYTDGSGGLFTSLTGRRRPLTAGALLAAALRRPFGSRRVLTLIHWQALRLWRRGAAFRPRPAPPANPLSRPGHGGAG